MCAIALAVMVALVAGNSPAVPDSASAAVPSDADSPGSRPDAVSSETPRLHPLETRDGRRVLVDDTILEHLQSSAPLPTQASLAALLSRATRVRIVGAGMVHGKAMDGPVLLDTSAPEHLTALRRHLVIAEDPNGFGHCLCLGSETFELYDGASLVASLGLHHGNAIRWDAWRADAPLAAPSSLVRWLASLGVSGPLTAVEQARTAAAQRASRWQEWVRAMPASLAPFRAAIDEYEQRGYARLDTRAMLAALRIEHPDPGDRARALFAWFGVGSGLWSGFPSYEAIVGDLLLACDTRELLAAIEGRVLTQAEAEGAARYFASWPFRKQKSEEGKLISPALRKSLFEVGSRSTSADRLNRTRAAFGEQ
jgi:hypothetical protein